MELKYGDSLVTLELPDFMEWRVLHKDAPFFLSEGQTETQIVNRGVDDLCMQLVSHLALRPSILLVVPDHTRKCNLPLILPLLIDKLESRFQARITILIANGSHALQPEETIRHLVSADIYDRYPTIQHNSQAEEELVTLGRTSNGTEIRLNKLVTKADFVITVGGILFHYFAGFGGGPKMLLPGVAAYETIRQNHSRTIDADGRFHPNAQNGNIETNPVYADLVQVLDVVPNVLSLQVVLSPQGQILFCEAGPILETQQKLIPRVKELYSMSLKNKYDVVIASAGGFPSDVNLIQSHKAIHHAFQVVKDNGALIIFAECREGIGSKTFLPYFDYSTSTDIGRALKNNFKINGQTALTLKEKAEKCQIYLISELQKRIVEKIGMIPCKRLSDVQLSHLKDKKVAIMPYANITVPL